MRLLALILAVCCTGYATPPPSAYAYGSYLPDGYAAHPEQNYPLILFLHGADGSNPPETTIADFLRAHGEFSFIVIAPRTDEDWSMPRLDQLLREVDARYRVDPQRRYLTGLSMGARGAAKFGARNPREFAAIGLVAGTGDPDFSCALRRVPVALFHNRDDEVVPLSVSQRYESALRDCFGRVSLKVLETRTPGQWTHDAWTESYTTPALYQWFLSHTAAHNP